MTFSIKYLKYKSDVYEKDFIQRSRNFPSSKICSQCGWKYEDLTLNFRQWTCPECGKKHNRDINASLNILNEGLKIQNRRDDGDSLVSKI
jgi:putative transposase